MSPYEICNSKRDKRQNLYFQPLLPYLPWQKVGTNLLKLNEKHYVVVVDYLSRYIELMDLRNQSSW